MSCVTVMMPGGGTSLTRVVCDALVDQGRTIDGDPVGHGCVAPATHHVAFTGTDGGEYLADLCPRCHALWCEETGRVTLTPARERRVPLELPQGPGAEQEALLRTNALVQRVVGDLCARLEAMMDAVGVPAYGPGIGSTTERVQAALEDYAVLRAERAQLTAGAPPDDALRADAQETARFAVFDALCLLTGEAGLRVAPEQIEAWAKRILESLLRVDVGWAIGILTDADAALRMRMRERRETLADHVHMVWARWMAWQGEHAALAPLVVRGRVPDPTPKHVAAVRRWERQAKTPYAKLTAAEQASGRAIADEYLTVLLGKED